MSEKTTIYITGPKGKEHEGTYLDVPTQPIIGHGPQCEHLRAAYPTGTIRCDATASFAVHDDFQTLTWSCAEHLAVTVADVSDRVGLFVKIECFAKKDEPVAYRRSQLARTAPVGAAR